MRIRTLKPGFFQSRSLARCSRDARLTFAGLWCHADDHGRGVADPRILKGAIWPLDDDIDHKRVEKHLEELEATGHISTYEHAGERFYEVSQWTRHQAASHRRGEPMFPAPVSNGHDPACKEVQDASLDVLEQGEGKGIGKREQGSAVRRVFDAWKRSVEAFTGKPSRVAFSKDRQALIGRRLRDHDEETLVAAVTGWAHSPFHRGENDRGAVYNSLELCLRNAEKVEQFAGYARDGPAVTGPRGAGAIARAVARRLS